MKRKLISAVLTASMIGSMAFGAVPAYANDIANEDITIGVSIWSSTDVLGSQCKLILDAAAEALGVNVQYVITKAFIWHSSSASSAKKPIPTSMNWQKCLITM